MTNHMEQYLRGGGGMGVYSRICTFHLCNDIYLYFIIVKDLMYIGNKATGILRQNCYMYF